MNDLFKVLLWDLASRFRRAIQECNQVSSPLATLRSFPRGSCGDASLLLAKYLQVNNCGRPLFVLGKRHGHLHAWLQLEGYAIDITADQFADQHRGVIVESDSAWHSSFNGKVHTVADFCLFDPHTAFQLTKAYEAIVCCL